MSVEINVKYEGGLRCTVTHGPSGAHFMTDAPLDNEGKAESFSPTDLVGTALGACIMTIIGIMAERKKIVLEGTNIKVTKEMASSPARRIGELKVKVTFPKGLDLSDEDRKRFERAVDTCPVKQSLHPDIKITAEFAY